MNTCTKCILHKTCKSINIGGRGSETPTVLFAGEMPGGEEDEQAKAFVGPSGRLLMQAIKEYSLTPCRITNAVRCHPPDNRTPKADEIKACRPYLVEEIRKYRPKIIATLGNIPLRALTGKTGVMSYAGSVVGEFEGAQVFALYHPSFILRYPANKARFEAHLKTLSRMIKGEEKQDAVKVNFVDCEMAKEILSRQDSFITFDFETTGKYSQYGGRITCVGFTCSDGTTLAVDASQRGFNPFMVWFLKSDKRKCAFNSVYETRWALDVWGIEPQNLVYDPFLMHYLHDENKSHALDSVASEFLQVESWDIAPEMKMNKWTWEDVPVPTLMKYCGLDTYYTHRLVKPLSIVLKDQGLVNFYQKILLPLSKLCARLEHRGIKIDVKHAKKWEDIYLAETVKLKKELCKLANLPDSFNPNSSKQLSEVLKKLKLKTTEKTKGGIMSVKASALEALEENSPFIHTYLKWKEKKVLANNFLQEYPKLVDVDGLIHPNFNCARIVTARIACSNPSAQNIPNDENVRGMVTSRFNGGQILSNDYKQLELRLVASESNDPRMLGLFQKGVDLHDVTAKEMFGANFTDLDRKIAKNINFGTVYGISAYALSKKFNVPKQVAEEWVYQFRKINPHVFRWLKEQHNFVMQEGYLKSVYGQRRRLPEAVYKEPWVSYQDLPYEVGRALRQAGNFPIQSQGACITNRAAILIDNVLNSDLEKTSIVCHVIHDAILVDVYPGEADKVMEICKLVMTEGMQKETPWLKLPLEVSQDLSERWGQTDDN